MRATGTGATSGDGVSSALLLATGDESTRAVLLEMVETGVRGPKDVGTGVGTLIRSEDVVAILVNVVGSTLVVVVVVVVVVVALVVPGEGLGVENANRVVVVDVVADIFAVVRDPMQASGSPLTVPAHVPKSAKPTTNGFSEPALAWMSKCDSGTVTPKSLNAKVVTRAATVANLVCISSTTIDRPTEASGAPNPVELIATALPNMAP